MTPHPYRENYLDQGAFFAISAAASITLLGLANRFALVELEVGFFPLMILQLFTGGICLLALGYRRDNRVELAVFKHPLSWGIALLRLGSLYFFLQAFSLISVTEAEFLIKWSVIFALLTAFFLKGSYPKGPLAWLGIPVLVLGLCLAMQNIPLLAVLFVVGTALCTSIEGTLAEHHPGLQKSFTWRQHLVFSGIIMVVTALMVLAAWVLRLLVIASPPEWQSFQQLFSPAVIIAGIVTGSLLRSLFVLFRHRAIRLLGNAYYLMATSLAPFMALGLESALHYAGYLAAPTLDGWDLFAGCIITLGSLLILIGRMIREQQRQA